MRNCVCVCVCAYASQGKNVLETVNLSLDLHSKPVDLLWMLG